LSKYTQQIEWQLKANIGEFTRGMRNAKGDIQNMAKVAKYFQDAFSRSGAAATTETKKLSKELGELIAKLEQLKAKGRDSMSQLTPKQATGLKGDILRVADVGKQAIPSNVAAKEAKSAEKAMREAETAAKQYNSTLITLRYAIYDVAGAVQQAGTALTTFSSASITAAAAQERAFSNIQKTQVGVDGSAESLRILKAQLLDLSSQIPVTFADLSKIGMLGAQLGIEAENLATFTATVAKFSAISGMSVDETAMGFGKIANLLGLSADQYESLGAAIAAVGVKSAATEQQIVNTAGQIGAIGKVAGLTNSEIIGMASAMASLKIAPEEARGVLVQAFHAMDSATRSFSANLGIGNESLDKFAEIAGISSKEFAEGWSDKKEGGAGKVWQQFITGLGKTPDASRALAQLGLEGIRVSKGLSALGEGFQQVNDQILIAKEAGLSGTFLDESYATIADDLASKLDMLKNSVENLMASLSSNDTAMGFMKGIVDALTFLTDGFRRLTEIPVFGFLVSGLSAVGIILTAIAGTIITVVAGLGLTAGSFLAMRTAVATARVELGGAEMSLANLVRLLFTVPPAAAAASAGMGANAAAMGVYTGATRTATVATKALKYALISTGIGAIIVLIGTLISGMVEMADAAGESAAGLDEQRKSAIKDAEALSLIASELKQIIDLSLEQSKLFLSAQDALYGYGKALRENGGDLSEWSDAGRESLSSLRSTIDALTGMARGDDQMLVNYLTALRNAMEELGYTGAFAFKMIDRAIQATGKVADGTDVDLFSFFDGLKSTLGGSGGVAEALRTTLDYARDLMSVFSDMSDLTFGRESGIVKMKNTIADIRKDAKDAKDAVKELKASLTENISERDTLLGRLQIATKFGAVQFAAETQKKLDELNANISASQSELAYNTELLSGTMNLNTQAGRDNFDTIMKLTDGYVAYIDGVAKTSKSQKEVNDAVKRSKDGFIAQLKAMNLSEEDIKKYSAQFDSMTEIVNGVPRRVTIDVNLSKAKQALQKFLDSINSSKGTVQIDAKGGSTGKEGSGLNASGGTGVKTSDERGWSGRGSGSASGGAKGAYGKVYNNPILSGIPDNFSAPETTMTVANGSFVKLPKGLYMQSLMAKGKSVQLTFSSKPNDDGYGNSFKIKGATVNVGPDLSGKYPSIKKFASGGMISGPGTGTSDSIPIMASNNEFMMNAASVRTYGAGFMNAVNQQRINPLAARGIMSSGMGGDGTRMVELSPSDRALLQAAVNRPVTLYTNDRIIAESANNGNKVLARNGIG
jgi:TP901 family phage tail tape measure protein